MYINNSYLIRPHINPFVNTKFDVFHKNKPPPFRFYAKFALNLSGGEYQFISVILIIFNIFSSTLNLILNPANSKEYILSLFD